MINDNPTAPHRVPLRVPTIIPACMPHRSTVLTLYSTGSQFWGCSRRLIALGSYLEAARRMEDSRLARERASPGLDPARDPFTDPAMMANVLYIARGRRRFKMKPRPWRQRQISRRGGGGQGLKLGVLKSSKPSPSLSSVNFELAIDAASPNIRFLCCDGRRRGIL